MTIGGAAFEWDPAKAASNLATHGVSFDSVTAFDLRTASIEPDMRRAYGEARMVAIGTIGDRVHVLVFTPRGDHIRVISLRKANDREVKRYGRTIQPQGDAG
jgi:uncharacterized DUF497 family protein